MPPEVYWRRRVVALIGVVVVLLLLIWLVAALVDGSAEQSVEPAAQVRSAAPPTSSGAIPVTGSGGALRQPPEDLRPSVVAAPASVPPASAPPAPAVSPVPPVPPGPPQPCPDAVTAVAARPAQAEYRVGAKPVFTLTVTNAGAAPCTRDLDAELQELLVFTADGVTRLWSSNDCYPGDSVDVRIMEPGQDVEFAVTWAGRSSNPGCAGKRVPIGAGDYSVVAKLGPLAGPPAPFRLTP